MRQDHLTEQEILSFSDRTLTASALLRADDHLASCSACRDRIWNDLDADRMVASLRSQFHAASKPSVHIPTTINHWVVSGAWIAAAALILVTVLLRFHRQEPAPAQVAQVAQIAPAVPAVALPPEYQAALDAAQRDGKLEHPPILQELIRRKGTLLASGDSERSYSVFRPVGTVVLADRPLFQWQAVPGARNYVVSVFDMDYRKVAESPALQATEWQPKTGLTSGRNYSWQVRAEVKGETIHWPRPPAPEAVFRVLESPKAEELNRAKEVPGGSHLLLGILYAREGLLDDAAEELKLADPAAARPLLDDLARLRQK